MIWTRRNWLLAMGALAGCSPRQTATGCNALTGKTIRWIVPFSDGGSHEIYSRVFEPFFEKSLGAELVITLEPGSGGIVGSTKLRESAPDGRTLGVLNSPGLFMASIAGHAPNPARDFAVIGRLGRSRPVIVAATSSKIGTIEDVLERQKTRPLVCGISGLGSNSLLVFSVTESLLGLRFDYIPGFDGSREISLALLRGDLDLMSSNLDSLQQGVDKGDFRVVLQIADGPIDNLPSMRDEASLGGAHGWAGRRATERGQDPKQAIADAQALIDLTATGIIVAAPPSLPDELLTCLRARFIEAASLEAFRSAAVAAQRTPDVANGEVAQVELTAAESHLNRFAPIVRDAFSRARK